MSTKQKGHRVCSLCHHPDREAADADIRGGMSDKKIAAKYEVHPSTVQRHRRAHLKLSRPKKKIREEPSEAAKADPPEPVKEAIADGRTEPAAATASDTTAMRVDMVAAMIASGKWNGHQSAAALTKQWNVSITTIHEYHRIAGHIVASSRADIIATKATTLARFDSVYRSAHNRATAESCKHCGRGKASDMDAAMLLRVASDAAERTARIEGVLVNQPPTVQIAVQNVMTNPMTAKVFGAVGRGLARLGTEVSEKAWALIREEIAALERQPDALAQSS